MASRNLKKAQQAYKQNNVELMKRVHNGEKSISRTEESSSNTEEDHRQGGEYIKSFIYGGLDGIITTYSVVAGSSGANLSVAVIIILGLSNLIGDGLSMALGDYLSSESKREFIVEERKRETWEYENNFEGEKEEMIQIYWKKGVSRKDARKVVDILAINKKAFIDIMMIEELGLLEGEESSIQNALVTFFSFACFGFIPIAPYVFAEIFKFQLNFFFTTTTITIFTMILLGVIKSAVTGSSKIKGGLQTLFVGTLAASSSYFVGWLLEDFKIQSSIQF